VRKVEFIYDRLNGLLASRIYRALSGLFIFRAVPVPGHRAEDAAQARPDRRAGPARGTILVVPSRVRAGLFRVVPVLAHRAWPIWPSITPGVVQLASCVSFS
jgi:hypothetical protein